MTEKNMFPFRLQKAFFISIQFIRIPELPEKVHLPLSAEVKVLANQFPETLHVRLRISTPEKHDLMLNLELVGIFTYVEGLPKLDKDIIPDFVNKRALHMLWPYMVQMISNITGQMGTNPIEIDTPYDFKIPLEADKPESAKKEE